MNKARFEAFSDGVFAFAITLLILGIALPEAHYASNHDLMLALLHLWPNVIAYALSFAVIGIMWQNHHALFRLVEKVDRTTVFVNLLLLAGTAFIPFATSTLGAYPTMPASAFLYGVVLSYCATIYNALLKHLHRRHAFFDRVGEATIASTLRAYRVGWVIYVLATLLALVAPIASFAAYVAVAIYYLVPRGVDADI
ncbi:MAG TPA: TMEM175 family protein [Candidatus Baltobacteraceae bacterium]|nr:TMEM175 family protein [Candidatus Baltobacteraceae bacterium]